MPDISEDVEPMIMADKRIEFVGWQSTKDLESLLCGADVYMQPGSQSATMQMSLCCHCAIVLENLDGHEMYVKGNGWLITEANEISDILMAIGKKQINLDEMKRLSKKIAIDLLDYSKLARKILIMDQVDQ